MATRLEDLSRALEDGASADVWYDAASHVARPDDPDDPDVVAMARIDRTQLAMVAAATELESLHGLLTRLDGAMRASGVAHAHGALLGEVRAALDRLGAEVAEPDGGPAAPSP